MKPALQTPRCNPGDTTVIEAVYHSEGRVAYTAGANPRYEYSIKDHPRNFGVGAPKSSTRLTFCDLNSDGAIQTPSEILQENHYYPFGLALNGPWMNNAAPDNLYQYNGKELQPDHGLGWYDYGARMFMPDLGRWNGVDALVDRYSGWSTYNYVLGNPVLFVDPDGRIVAFAGDEEERAYNEYKKEVNSRINFYDKRINRLEKRGKFDRAQSAKTDKAVYTQIKSELASAEENTDFVFRIRMGDNQTSTSDDSGGNTSYNKETKEIDVNIGDSGPFTTTQKLAHEFTHVNQFLEGELDFSADTGEGGLLYDKTDEAQAYIRTNLFSTVPENYVGIQNSLDKPNYNTLPSFPVNLQNAAYVYKNIDFNTQYQGQVKAGKIIYNSKK